MDLMSKIPAGMPPAFAIAILTSGYTKKEAFELLMDTGDFTQEQVYRWIAELVEAGFFGAEELDQALSGVGEKAESPNELDDNLPMVPPDESSMDGNQLLWMMLLKELRHDENDFKHRIMVVDQAVKKRSPDLHELSKSPADRFIPFSAVTTCPWQGCKFVAGVVLYLLTKVDVHSKQSAVRPFSYSLGGCTVQPHKELCATRWPYQLLDTFIQAGMRVAHGTITRCSCVAMHIQITDLEIMRNPGRRPGTFAHSCVMTISVEGVYLYHGYGPRGYTLLQHMENHEATHGPRPLSTKQAMEWVTRFQEFAGDLGGVWTDKVNAAYAYCFGVDLVAMGNMRLGSQLDCLVDVYSYDFDANLVRQNFALLPLPNQPITPSSANKKILCQDGVNTKSPIPDPRYIPDGGVPHRYVPLVLRCAKCGASTAPSCCGKCQKVRYCGKECQTMDWKRRHKLVCKSLAQKEGSRIVMLQNNLPCIYTTMPKTFVSKLFLRYLIFYKLNNTA